VAGRPRKYPINTLEVGESLIIPWRVDKRGMPGDQKPIYNAIQQEQRRFKKKFEWKPQARGVLVIRRG